MLLGNYKTERCRNFYTFTYITLSMSIAKITKSKNGILNEFKNGPQLSDFILKLQIRLQSSAKIYHQFWYSKGASPDNSHILMLFLSRHWPNELQVYRVWQYLWFTIILWLFIATGLKLTFARTILTLVRVTYEDTMEYKTINW